MRRHLWLVDLSLLALTIWCGTALRDRWSAASTREQALLRQMVPPGPAPVLPTLPPVTPSTSAAYMEVAQQFLFSKDRSPNVILDPPPAPPPPKPMPPLPLAYGMMDLGSGPTVILSERSGGQQRNYRPGEQIGEFKLVAIRGDELTFEWDGKEVKRRLEEIVDRKAAESTTPPAEANAAAASPAPPPPRTQSTTVAAPTGPGVELSETSRACVHGDTTPPGTVQGGFRKVVTKTPFGDSCRWEKAQ